MFIKINEFNRNMIIILHDIICVIFFSIITTALMMSAWLCDFAYMLFLILNHTFTLIHILFGKPRAIRSWSSLFCYVLLYTRKPMLVRTFMNGCGTFGVCILPVLCLFLNRIIWAKRVVSRFDRGISRGQAMLSLWRNPTFSGVYGKGTHRPDGLRVSSGCTGHVHAGQVSLLRRLSTLEGTANFGDYVQLSNDTDKMHIKWYIMLIEM